GRVDGDDDLVTTGRTTRTIGLGEGFRGVCGFLFQDLDDLDTLGFGDPSDGDCVATGIDGRVDGDDDLVTTGHTVGAIGLGVSTGLVEDFGDLSALGGGDAQGGDCAPVLRSVRVDGDDDLVTTGHTTRTIGL